jgi:hypothetical protein
MSDPLPDDSLRRAAEHHRLGQLDKAEALYRHILSTSPREAEILRRLGEVLARQGRLAEALASIEQAILIQPHSAAAHNSMGVVLEEMERRDEALSSFERAVSLRYEYAEAHMNLAMALLRRGKLRRGWREMEWRLRSRLYVVGEVPGARWTGEPVGGRTIFLHIEQGLGDTIQFIRYAALLAERGARVIVGGDLQRQRLLASAQGVAQVILEGESLPPFDFQCPLMSLPHVFDTVVQSVPANVPYLQVDAGAAESFARRLEADPAPRKVGVVWAGAPGMERDAIRSIAPALLSPWAGIRGVRLYSLQKGDAAVRARSWMAEVGMVDWTGELTDLADTAALVSALDLVISVDTSVAHLAGALAKPVWTLLTFAPDWRWMYDRTDTPWYPTMRLFRQPRRGDWESVVRDVADALAAQQRESFTAW